MRCLIALIAAVLLLPAIASGNAPELNIWVAATNPNGLSASAECNAFWRDFRNPETGLADALKSRFDCFYVVIDQHRIEAAMRGIKRVPTFCGPNGRCVIGYSTPEDLLHRLGLRPAAPPAAVPQTPPAVSPAAPLVSPATSGPTVSPEELDEVERCLETRINDVVDALRKHASDLQALKETEPDDPSAPVLHDHANRLRYLYQLFQELKARQEQREASMSAAAGPSIATPPAGSGIPWGSIVGTLTSLGVGGPIAGAAAAGVTVAMWLIRRRRARRTSARKTTPTVPPEPCASCSVLRSEIGELAAALEEQTAAAAAGKPTETRYVRVPTSDAAGEAYREALRRVAELKGDSAVSLLNLIESTAKQILAGSNVRARANQPAEAKPGLWSDPNYSA